MRRRVLGAADTVAEVMGEINLTRGGLLDAAQHGITPEEVWQIADADKRVVHPVGEASRIIWLL